LGFSSAWLALREPADRAARDAALMAAAVDAAGPAPLILDLGCGTGATRRALASSLPEGARWLLVDHDPVLLALAEAPDARTIEADLSALETLPWEQVTLVTCSALLDLVSADWLDRLFAILSEKRLPLYAALSYNGVMVWDPPDPLDTAITSAFNDHQRRDKGFGPALGPDAVPGAVARLEIEGFSVQTAASPWRLSHAQTAMQAELFQGIASAAAELDVGGIENWASGRKRLLPHTMTIVGHDDLLAIPNAH
jgi:SAM-dependent methyltransferase